MKGALPNFYHSCTIFFFVSLQFHHVFSTNTLSSNETLTISSNRTLVSPGDVFELGFFKTTTRNSQDGADRWYLGIWYKTTSDQRTYVWVANRDNPLHNSTGTLKISHSSNLVLLDQSDTPVWSTNFTGVAHLPVTAELLANGNLVLRDSKTKDLNRFVWQSFDFPVDTLLPEMKLGRKFNSSEKEKILTSWKSPTDPSSGDYSFILETEGFLHEFYLLNNEFKVYRTGPWNEVRFNGIPKMQNWSYINNNFIDNKEEVAYSFQVNDNHNIHSRFRMSSTGYLQVITWTKTAPQRNMFWSFPEDTCDLYIVCGPYAYCDMHTSPTCNCIKGFVPKNEKAWELRDASSGCERSKRLSCGEGDGFLRMSQMKLPETSEAVVDEMIGLKECREKCVRDCNCTGYANMDNMNGLGCVMWTGELLDMRKYDAGGHDIYVKVAEASLVPS
ncbi:putative (S1) [Raphanus sativus]|uniref:S-locus-specific glycoprotein-like n=1 Tax=Raphanus sativus TaxID=3726 RepID=A0A9W3DLA8_RAPSA|nr:S-locus-specific glycoprotein-like [Raphanus sativus]KAJ4903553.1 putative (S1) [Raphanus sativus]